MPFDPNEYNAWKQSKGEAPSGVATTGFDPAKYEAWKQSKQVVPKPESGLKQFGIGLLEGVSDVVPSVEQSLKTGAMINPAIKPVEMLSKIPLLRGRTIPETLTQTREDLRQFERPESLGGKAARLGGYVAPMILTGKKSIPVSTPESLAAKSMKLREKAEKLTTELLNPPKKELSLSIEKGEKLPAVKETTDIIKKSKTYGDLRTNFKNKINEIMSERNNILREKNRSLQDYTQPLREEIEVLKKGGQATESEIAQMEEVLNKENAWFSKNAPDRLSGQSRKEYLQNLTEKLLKKTERGDVIDTQPARTRALDRIRYGLRQEIERGDPKIGEINSRYAGLDDAVRYISGEEALSQKAIPQNAIQKITGIVSRAFYPKSIPHAIAEEAFNAQKNLPKTTGKIEKLISKSKKIESSIPKVFRRGGGQKQLPFNQLPESEMTVTQGEPIRTALEYEQPELLPPGTQRLLPAPKLTSYGEGFSATREPSAFLRRGRPETYEERALRLSRNMQGQRFLRKGER